MGYSVKKAGISFKAKLDTGADLSGKAAGFVAYYINDTTGIRTDITGAFTESVDAAGLYFSPDISISEVGDYTLVIKNAAIGMDNHPTPIVVVSASIDDIKGSVDELRIVADTIAADVDGLDGTTLQGIRDNLSSIKLLIDDADGSSVNSIMEFVAKIDSALVSGSTGLAALAGFTDDIENMLLGTEFLADGVTANPLFGASNVDLKSLVSANLVALQGNIVAAQTAIEAKVTAAKDELLLKVADVQSVVDANSTKLSDAGFGLAALKVLLDTISTNVSAIDNDDVLAVLNDTTNGLANIYTTLVNRFDSVDADLASIENKVDLIGGAQSFRAFV